MKGIRLPMGVFTRSLSPPNSGSRKSARILSAAMMTPVQLSSSRKLFARIRGTTLSYICQKALMDKNASPTRMVRLVLSFIGEFLFSV